MNAAPPPPPRGVPPPPLPRRTSKVDSADSQSWEVKEAVVPTQCEPKRHGSAVPLPSWLLKQRDLLFREATSFTNDTALFERRASPSAMRDERLRLFSSSDSQTHSSDSVPTPRTVRSNSPRKAAPTPPKRHSVAPTLDNERASEKPTRGEASLSKARASANYTRRSLGSPGGKTPESRESSELVLEEAISQRDIANQCVKSLTAEVIRLAGMMHTRTETPSTSPRETAHRNDVSQPVGARVGRNIVEGSILSSRLLQKLIRLRIRARVRSVMQTWKSSVRWSQRSCWIGENLRKRHQVQFSRAVLNVWCQHVRQEVVVEQALESRTEKQVDAAFVMWRHSKDRESAGNIVPLNQPFGFNDSNDLDVFRGKERAREQEREQERRKSYIKHVALKQMHARWRRRKIFASFNHFVKTCQKSEQHARLCKIKFLRIGTRYINNLLRRSIRAMRAQRLRALKRQRAEEANYLKILQTLKVVLLAWGACVKFSRDFLFGEHHPMGGKSDLFSSVQKLTRTLSNLDCDKSMLSHRLNLLEQELSQHVEERLPHTYAHMEQSYSNALIAYARQRILKMTPDKSGNYVPSTLASRLPTRGDVSQSIDQTPHPQRDGKQQDVDAMEEEEQLEEQRRTQALYETFAATLQDQASDIQNIHTSYLDAAETIRTLERDKAALQFEMQALQQQLEESRDAGFAAAVVGSVMQQETDKAALSLATLERDKAALILHDRVMQQEKATLEQQLMHLTETMRALERDKAAHAAAVADLSNSKYAVEAALDSLTVQHNLLKTSLLGSVVMSTDTVRELQDKAATLEQQLIQLASAKDKAAMQHETERLTQQKDMLQQELLHQRQHAAAKKQQIMAREGLAQVLMSIVDGNVTLKQRLASVAAAVEARQARQCDTWAAFDELEALLQEEAAHQQDPQTFVDTILCTPGSLMPNNTINNTLLCSVSRQLPCRSSPAKTAQMLAPVHGEEQSAVVFGNDWGKIRDLLSDMQDPAVTSELPGITLQLIREHFEDLSTAVLSIRKKDPNITEQSLRRLQVNASLLHIESAGLPGCSTSQNPDTNADELAGRRGAYSSLENALHSPFVSFDSQLSQASTRDHQPSQPSTKDLQLGYLT